MTLHKYEQIVVEENKWTDKKKAYSIIFRLSIGYVSLAVLVASFISAMLNMLIALGSLILLIFFYNFLIDFLCEDEKQFKKMRVFASLWWLAILLTIGGFIVLRYFKVL